MANRSNSLAQDPWDGYSPLYNLLYTNFRIGLFFQGFIGLAYVWHITYLLMVDQRKLVGKYTSHIVFIWVEVGMPHIGPEKKTDPTQKRTDLTGSLRRFFLKLGGEGKRNGYQIKNLDLFRVIFYFLLAVAASISSAAVWRRLFL